MIVTVLQIALGGAIGAVLRFGTYAAMARWFGAGFPFGTLAVNVLGSGVMGLLAALLLERAGAPRLAPLLMTGVLGGYTTFSAFSLDTLLLIERGEPGRALVYVAASVALSVGALWGGLLLGRSL
jgi:CrcB protein